MDAKLLSVVFLYVICSCAAKVVKREVEDESKKFDFSIGWREGDKDQELTVNTTGSSKHGMIILPQSDAAASDSEPKKFHFSVGWREGGETVNKSEVETHAAASKYGVMVFARDGAGGNDSENARIHFSIGWRQQAENDSSSNKWHFSVGWRNGIVYVVKPEEKTEEHFDVHPVDLKSEEQNNNRGIFIYRPEGGESRQEDLEANPKKFSISIGWRKGHFDEQQVGDYTIQPVTVHSETDGEKQGFMIIRKEDAEQNDEANSSRKGHVSIGWRQAEHKSENGDDARKGHFSVGWGRSAEHKSENGDDARKGPFSVGWGRSGGAEGDQ